ncbi:hypothetical protein FQN53_006200 [Emmonsiellopsis sp. PD_33]|nr:hypothetical protein FQN53_006200 [Emmonsiellopsis sp. PD_33]
MGFPAPHIINATAHHTHTIILLHGRSSDGDELAEELMDSMSSEGKSLATHFPGCRWVFPTSQDWWSSVFREDLTAWFDIYSLSSPCEKQEVQVDGLQESTLYILDVLRGEIDLLGGRSERVVLGGISQGMATALWALLCSPGRVNKGKIGGFIGMCGWLPFTNKIESLQSPGDTSNLLLDIIGCKEPQASKAETETMVSTPVLLLHGTDDAWIDVELGRHACRCLTKIGMHVDWVEYSGAENEGHWVKEPEGFDTIVRFLNATWPGIG